MCLFGLQAVTAQSWKNNRTWIDGFISMGRARDSRWLKFLCELNFIEFKFFCQWSAVKRFLRIHCDIQIYDTQKKMPKASYLSIDLIQRWITVFDSVRPISIGWALLICDCFFLRLSLASGLRFARTMSRQNVKIAFTVQLQVTYVKVDCSRLFTGPKFLVNEDE